MTIHQTPISSFVAILVSAAHVTKWQMQLKGAREQSSIMIYLH